MVLTDILLRLLQTVSQLLALLQDSGPSSHCSLVPKINLSNLSLLSLSVSSSLPIACNSSFSFKRHHSYISLDFTKAHPLFQPFISLSSQLIIVIVGFTSLLILLLLCGMPIWTYLWDPPQCRMFPEICHHDSKLCWPASGWLFSSIHLQLNAYHGAMEATPRHSLQSNTGIKTHAKIILMQSRM